MDDRLLNIIIDVVFILILWRMMRSTGDQIDMMNTNLYEIQKVMNQTHALVNSSTGTQLKLYAETARALAMKTGDQVHKVAAETAENVLREHERRQMEADKF